MSDEWDPEDTDPDVFAEPAVAAELPETKRVCMACGAELPPCDCARAARAAVTEVLEVLIERLVRSGRYTRVEAAREANALAAEAGITLL